MNSDTPLQSDGGSCGVFTLFFDDCVTLRAPTTLMEENMGALHLQTSTGLLCGVLLPPPVTDEESDS